MIGCLIAGGLALFALGRLHRHHRGWCWTGGLHGGWHGRWGGWGRGGHHRWHHPLEDHDPEAVADAWPDRGLGQRHFLRAVLGRLRATPAQERAIREAVGTFRAEIEKLGGGEVGRTRAELADALRRPTFDGISLGEQFARHDSILEGARKAFVGLVTRVHDALEPEQRQDLAKLIERGPRFGWWH